jgi:hypothetical protein
MPIRRHFDGECTTAKTTERESWCWKAGRNRISTRELAPRSSSSPSCLKPPISEHVYASVCISQGGTSDVETDGTRKRHGGRIIKARKSQPRPRRHCCTRLPTLGAAGTPHRITRSRLVPGCRGIEGRQQISSENSVVGALWAKARPSRPRAASL